eukprot:GHRR01021961.1.p3 GENE.GHRR01021961.1~~GHRR01021961.1.p3  ORF type:complete len:103 (+),score=37.88 GHRR01021961.1:1083-1391(+)
MYHQTSSHSSNGTCKGSPCWRRVAMGVVGSLSAFTARLTAVIWSWDSIAGQFPVQQVATSSSGRTASLAAGCQYALAQFSGYAWAVNGVGQELPLVIRFELG